MKTVVIDLAHTQSPCRDLSTLSLLLEWCGLVDQVASRDPAIVFFAAYLLRTPCDMDAAARPRCGNTSLSPLEGSAISASDSGQSHFICISCNHISDCDKTSHAKALRQASTPDLEHHAVTTYLLNGLPHNLGVYRQSSQKIHLEGGHGGPFSTMVL
jgi:hypothetical protein